MTKLLDRAIEAARELPAEMQDEIAEAIDLLGHQPRAGRKTTKPSTRRLNLAPYPNVMLYRVTGDNVVVTRFLHSARKSA